MKRKTQWPGSRVCPLLSVKCLRCHPPPDGYVCVFVNVCVLRVFMDQGYNSLIHSETRHLRRRLLTCVLAWVTQKSVQLKNFTGRQGKSVIQLLKSFIYFKVSYITEFKVVTEAIIQNLKLIIFRESLIDKTVKL